ncbi:MAG: right-handed parallel beta-helix repeat-containing protein [Planctomycetes bacterium]|nr:right-handed parallel beta-helix repeat-containing protein [Planctomycetota bacterium]
MRTLGSLALAAALGLPALAISQAQVHVSPSGSDVTGDGSLANPYKTISYAESQAASGDTLLLAAGTFGDDEQIVLGSKDITIVGAGVGVTTVRPHPTLVYALPRGFPNAPYLEDHRCVFVVEGSRRVDIRNLTADGAFRMPPTGRLTGIYYRNGADGTVQDVEITNCRSDPINGAQGPVGVVVRGDGVADFCNVTLRSCTIREWGKNGIASFFDTVLTVEHCTITGSGRLDVPLAAQNCVQLTYGAVGIIRFNRISDSDYIPAAWGASGLLIYSPGSGTVVEGNEFARCEGSIWLYASPPANLPTYIRNNTVTACFGGALWIQSMTGVVATGNTFHMPIGGEIPVYDDASGGNTWSGNRYSDYGGVGPYAIDGGACVDPSPVDDCNAFGASTSVALGVVPIEMLALQLNGGGGLDFVTVNEGATPSLSVGLESGGSYVVSNVPFGSAAGRAVSLVAGNFDGVGGTDVAVLTTNVPPAIAENKVYVFSNSGGVLSLLHVENLGPPVFAASDLAVGAFDGAAGDDLAVADLGTIGIPGSVRVLLNGGAGTSWSASTIGGFTTQCVALGSGDLTGDAIADLAVAEGDGTSGRVHVLVGLGAGAFVPHGIGPVTIADNPSGLAVGDLDGDGRPDVVACSYGASLPLVSGAVTVLRNQLPGSMGVAVSPTDRGPVHVSIGDFDDDDDPDSLRRDAVVANFVGATLTVCGAFGEVGGFASASLCTGGVTPRAALLADMDGDGYADLIVADASGQAVVIVDGRPTARVDVYGAGCPGTSDRIPVIAAVGAPALPTQPNLSFGIECRDARPFSVAVLNASTAPAVALGACNLLLASIDVSWVQFTNGVGRAAVSIAVPSAPPALAGAALYFQWAVIDPQGDLLGFIALSEGLKIRVGY